MRTLNLFYLIMLLSIIGSCKKERIQNSGNPNTPVSNKKTLVANAGPDQVITLPTATVTLDGSSSYDSTGTPLNYLWKALAFPPANIPLSTIPITTASLTVPGKYKFVLEIWNNNGIARDTVEVTLKQICDNYSFATAQLVPVTTVPEDFDWETPLIYAAGKKLIVHKDWEYDYLQHNNPVSIYDVETNSWIKRYLPTNRTGAAVVVAGNKVFFAGGAANPENLSQYMTDKVEIYDITTDSWSSTTLSEKRKNIKAAVAGNKIFFAGGVKNGEITSNKVDIYDVTTGSWSATTLQGPAREVGSAVAMGNSVFFCGGITARNIKTMYHEDGSTAGAFLLPSAATRVIDIYDASTGNWTLDSMAVPRIDFTAVASNDKLFLAGGIDMTMGYPNTISNNNFTSTAEVKKFNPSQSEQICLSRPAAGLTSVKQGDKVIFFSGSNDASGKFDIYNTITGAWTITTIPGTHFAQSSIVALNNDLYVVTVNAGTRIYKLTF